MGTSFHHYSSIINSMFVLVQVSQKKILLEIKSSNQVYLHFSYIPTFLQNKRWPTFFSVSIKNNLQKMPLKFVLQTSLQKGVCRKLRKPQEKPFVYSSNV